MKSYKVRKLTLSAFAVALCIVCVITGCNKSESEKTPSNLPAYAQDKVFMQKCEEMEKEKRGIMKRFSAARRELAAVKAKDPKSPRVAELESYMRKLEEEHQANRRNTQRMVAEKLKATSEKQK